MNGAAAHLLRHGPGGILRQVLGRCRTHAQSVIGQGCHAHEPGTTVNIRAVAANDDVGGGCRRAHRKQQAAAYEGLQHGSDGRKVLFINEETVSLHRLSSWPPKRLPSISAACRTFPE